MWGFNCELGIKFNGHHREGAGNTAAVEIAFGVSVCGGGCLVGGTRETKQESKFDQVGKKRNGRAAVCAHAEERWFRLATLGRLFSKSVSNGYRCN